jgi:DNA-binding PadR family transcriptional regulator
MALLTLLEPGPVCGYQLRADFERRTAGAWPLNIGQVYTTLHRLEQGGLCESSAADRSARRLHSLTGAGRFQVQAWFGAAVDRESAPRDEFAIKLALALGVSSSRTMQLLQTQRLEALRSLERQIGLRAAACTADVAQALLIDGRVMQAEAELRWLDHCEATLAL